MTAVATIAPGSFCWVDLGTTDPSAAKQFYTKLFGWSYSDTPMDEGETYTIFQIGDKTVGAAYRSRPDPTAKAGPPVWRSYVSVPNVDAFAEKAASLGGTVLRPPVDAMDAGRMVTLRDPSGALIALWQPKQHAGMDISGQPNSVCWYELLTNDLPRARAFYTSLLGWTTEDQPMGPMTYTTIKNQGQQIGGMMAMQPEWGNIPSHWMIYFAVADCDHTANAAKALGATVHKPPTDIPGIGRFAMLQDPQGAGFAIIQLRAS